MTFINDHWIRDGTGKSYFENCQIKFEGIQKNDKAHDYWTFYNNDGTISFYVRFENEKCCGYGEKFDLCGKICSKGQWENGILYDIYILDLYLRKGYVSQK